MKRRIELSVVIGLLAACGVRSETLVWTGGGGDLQWDTATNWEPAQVPATGDAVEISSASGEIVLAGATAELSSFSLSGATVSMTNWTTCLSADVVEIGEGGVLTCTATDDTTLEDGEYVGASRVWVVCRDLTIASGGAIDVNAKGFACPMTNSAGLGPYPASKGFGYGAGHGGVATDAGTGHKPCGSIEEPTFPGSSGGYSAFVGHNTAFGGGVVRIDATGCVTVRGSITADGGAFLKASNNARAQDNSGAGGSVWITCDRFVGADGVVSVRGGDYKVSYNSNGYGKLGNPSNYPHSTVYAYNGAGGRIAIHYNAESQQVGDVSGMRFDASSGSLLYPDQDPNTDFARKNRTEPGTLYFTDSSMFVAQEGQGFAGQLYIPGFDSWSTEGDYTISTQMRFSTEGFQLNVGGDLVVAAPMGALQIGGSEVALHYWPDGNDPDPDYLRYDSGTTPWKLTVGGNMTLESGTSFEAFPASVEVLDEASAYGAFVNVGGALTLEPGTIFSTRCVPTNGAAVFYTAGSVDVQAEALINAVDFGFEHLAGPGGSAGVSCGGGYGGFGSSYVCQTNSRTQAVTYHGWTYGDPLRPWQPGSGSYYGRHYPRCRGAGGAVRIRTTGDFVLNGTIDASGPYFGINNTDTSGLPGSGGGIFLECRKFSGTGALKADGGSIVNHSNRANYRGSGGGGRIAVYTGITYDPETMNEHFLTVSETAPETFTGTATVKGGTYTRSGTTYDPVDLYDGQPGTVRFVHCSIPYSLIMVR